MSGLCTFQREYTFFSSHTAGMFEMKGKQKEIPMTWLFTLPVLIFIPISMHMLQSDNFDITQMCYA
jgi:hypothetical protein